MYEKIEPLILLANGAGKSVICVYACKLICVTQIESNI